MFKCKNRSTTAIFLGFVNESFRENRLREGRLRLGLDCMLILQFTYWWEETEILRLRNKKGRPEFSDRPF